MLAVPWAAPFADDAWAFELKWDGVRALLTCDGAAVGVHSRRGNEITARYPELAAVTTERPTVLDGEIVTLDDSGRPSFELLQQRMNLAGGARIGEAVAAVPITYVVFDVLFDEEEIVAAPWAERRERLESLALPGPMVVSSVVAGDSDPLWRFVEERGLEGIVAKRTAAPYRPGVRSPDWRKITRFRQVRAVVGGYLPGEGGRRDSFGSLLLGLGTASGLRWIGAVGSGFDGGALAAIRAALDEMRRADCPFLPDPEVPRTAVWVEPRLVALVQYKEFTSAGRLRGPSFKGFTDDPPEVVTWEREGPSAS